MAKIEKKIKINKEAILDSLPFTKYNYIIFLCGILSILFGYIALSQEPWDGYYALVVAPILLVLGYCILIPVGILYHKKQSLEKNN